MRFARKMFIVVIIAIFFLTVRIQTRGEIITQPIIETEEIDQMIEQYERNVGEYPVERDVLLNDIINMKITEKAYEAEAMKRGITVSDNEIEKHIEEQISYVKEMINEDPDMNDMYMEMLNERNMTLEEFFWEVVYNQMKHQFLMDKLFQEIDAEGVTEPQDYGKLFEEIEISYREKNKDQIERLRRKYGILHMEPPNSLS